MNRHYIELTEQEIMNLVRGYKPRNKQKLIKAKILVERKATSHKQTFWVKK